MQEDAEQDRRNQQEDEINSLKQENSEITVIQSLRESLIYLSNSVSSFYSWNNLLLTSNFAGNENKLECNPDNHLIEDETKLNNSDREGELGWWSTFFTFVKLNLVAGFLFIPGGFKEGGWLFGVFSVFAIGLIMIYSYISLSECSDYTNSFSLSNIGLKAGGECGYYCMQIGISISQISFSCTYVNLVTQIVNNIINKWFETDNNYSIYIGFFQLVILIPLCLIRKISKFSRFHLFGDIAVLITLANLITVSLYKILGNSSFEFKNLKKIDSGWYIIISMSCVCFEGIGIILPIKQNMKNKKAFNSVVVAGILVICCIHSSFGLIMYFSFQNNTDQIIINNLTLNRTITQVDLILLMLSVLIVYPITLYPAFDILEKFLFNKTNVKSAVSNSNICLENILRIFIVFATTALGIFSINKFDTIVTLFGSAICLPISLILPAVFHFNLYKNTQNKLRNILDIAMFALALTLIGSIVFGLLK